MKERNGYRFGTFGKTLRISDDDDKAIFISIHALPRLVGDLLDGMSDAEIQAVRDYLMQVSSRRAFILDGEVYAPQGMRYVIPLPNVNVEALLELGKEWSKGNLRRVYFDPLQGWYGLMIERKPAGAIASIRFRGEPITEREAAAVIRRFAQSKVWYDFGDESFHSDGVFMDDFGFIIEQIRTLCAQWEEEQTEVTRE